MDFQLSKKVALITGGSRGIGFAAAKSLALEGALIAIAARDADQLEQARQELSSAGSSVLTIAADLTRSGDEVRVMNAVMAEYGRLDILVNSAGAAQGGVFWELSDEEWQSNLALKLFGTIRMMRAAIPTMLKQRYGRIVTIAGAAGRQPEAHLMPVGVANAGLYAITRALADELGPEGIVLTALNPGVTRTDRFLNRLKIRAQKEGRTLEDVQAETEKHIRDHTPMRRVGTADDIAAWITFLASDRAAHFTGQSITVDGGLNRPPG